MIEVIIPSYNCSKTLPRTLFSLCAQLDKNFSVLVVDDCSTENILDIVNSFTDKLNIRYIRNDQNMGCGVSRKIGIDNTLGDYITFLDSDDVFMPYTIEIFNQMVKSNPNVELFDSQFYEEVCDELCGALITHKTEYYFCHGKLYKMDYLNKLNIGYVPEVKYADDIYLNTICCELTDVYEINIPMLIWTNNIDSVMRRRKDKQYFRYEVLRDYLNNIYKAISFVLKHKKINEMKFLDAIIQMQNAEYRKYHKLFSEEQLNEINDLNEKLNNLIFCVMI